MRYGYYFLLYAKVQYCYIYLCRVILELLILSYRLDKNLSAKVADFGLSRDVYAEDYYKMQSATPLPVKWLAPEALFDREFSVKTDVVSVEML